MLAPVSVSYKPAINNTQATMVALGLSLLLHVLFFVGALIIGAFIESKPISPTLSQSTQVKLLQSLADLTEPKQLIETKEEPQLKYQDTGAVNETTEKLDTNLFGANTTKAASTQAQQTIGDDISQAGIDRPYKETLSTPIYLPQEAKNSANSTSLPSLLDAIDLSMPEEQSSPEIKPNQTKPSETKPINQELPANSYTNPDKSITVEKNKEVLPLPEPKTQPEQAPQQMDQLPSVASALSLPNQQTQLTGLSTMANQSSLEVNKSQLGTYGKEMSNLVELAWQRYNLENRQYIDPGFLRIRFKVNANGYTSDFEIVQVEGCNDVQKSVTIEAIKHCKLPPIPADLIQELGDDFFFVSYTFYY